MFEHVFVTVGTTSFQQLIQLVLSEEAIKQFLKWNVKQVRIQSGSNSIHERNRWKHKGIQFEAYDYKPSIVEDMLWADLIISHAGAGTTIEALDLGKVLIAVPNESLMDNHQIELAKKLDQENYAFMANIENFFERVEGIDARTIRKFPPARPGIVIDFMLDNVVGSRKSE